MKFEDITNMKHAKLVATTGIATVTMLAGTAQALACAPKHSQPVRHVSYTRHTERPSVSTPVVHPAVVTTTVATPTQPVSTPTSVQTTTVTIASTPSQAVKAATTQQPATLPATGPGGVIAPAAGMGFIGYAGNLIRIKRKHHRRQD